MIIEKQVRISRPHDGLRSGFRPTCVGGRVAKYLRKKNERKQAPGELGIAQEPLMHCFLDLLDADLADAFPDGQQARNPLTLARQPGSQLRARILGGKSASTPPPVR